MIRYLTAGESHGPALCGIIDGLPPHLKISQKDFDDLMKKRQEGLGRGKRMSLEQDKVEVLSGIMGGKTTGSPIALLIRNQDFENHRSYMEPFCKPSAQGRLWVPLPGHADLTGIFKYSFSDCRPVRERASARDTAMLTALSVPVRALLKKFNINSFCFIESIGGIEAKKEYNTCDKLKTAIKKNGSELLTPDPAVIPQWKKLIKEASDQGRSLGGTGCIIFTGLPMGLGSYVQHDRRIDSRLGEAIMGIPGIKGFEIGNALELSKTQKNSADDIETLKNRRLLRTTNNSGGTEGGMTTSQPLILRFHMKPLPGGHQSEHSVNLRTWRPVEPEYYRSDTCAIQPACIAAESLASIVLADALLTAKSEVL